MKFHEALKLMDEGEIVRCGSGLKLLYKIEDNHLYFLNSGAWLISENHMNDLLMEDWYLHAATTTPNLQPIIDKFVDDMKEALRIEAKSIGSGGGDSGGTKWDSAELRRGHLVGRQENSLADLQSERIETTIDPDNGVPFIGIAEPALGNLAEGVAFLHVVVGIHYRSRDVWFGWQLIGERV